MPMVTGQGSALQIGQETTWGTAANPSEAINYTNEGFKLVVDRKEEDTLVGGATTRDMDIMKKSVDWSFDILAKPENIGLLMGLALGVEADAEVITATSGYKHVFTMLKPSVSASLPKFTAIVNRHVAKKAYTGCKVDGLSIKCAAGDYMRISLSGKGKDESDGSSLFNQALTIPSLKAFRFAGGSCTFDGVTFGDVTNVSIDLANALDEGEQTLGSGYYGTENEPQAREISISLDTFYNARTESIREGKYKTENYCAVVLNFESPSEIEEGLNYSLKISLPRVAINSCDPNVSGKDKIRLTIGGKACETALTEAITVELVDSISDEYLA